MVKHYYHRLRTHHRRWPRILIGLLLIAGGLLGFLPVLGFWMLPLGIVLLSVDFHWIRRLRRRFEVWWGRSRLRSRLRRAWTIVEVRFRKRRANAGGREPSNDGPSR